MFNDRGVALQRSSKRNGLNRPVNITETKGPKIWGKLHLNKEQRNLIRGWRQLLLQFARREWFPLLICSSLGAVAAGLTRLFLFDRLFKSFAVATYLPSAKHFDDSRLYFPYAVAIALMIGLALIGYGPGVIARGFRSWTAGVASGLCLLPFTSMFLVLTLFRSTIQCRLLTHLAIITIFFMLGYLLYLSAKMRGERTLTEEDLRVPFQTKSLVGTEVSESDDPIQSWRQDALGRAALVDSISIKLMIAKTPVLALFGEFGSGKTSILNLLREHLGGKAIVVPFSTWLPGSQETLISYLLGDIANECQKRYVVPGLSKSARRLASALAKTVPFLKGYSELFPAVTQRDDIQAMSAALARLPVRVIVLLDELDRMEKEELLTLLKVIRGIASLQNLSFVCATDRPSLVTTVKGDLSDESNLYFEKFFPVSVQVPKADADALRKTGVERLVAALNRRTWFENESEAEDFRKQIDSLWNERIAPFCRNLRQIGLLANDVGAAAALLRREVHPVDLTLVELLRRFKPSVYEFVGRNSVVLTGAESWSRAGGYQTSEQTKRLKQKLLSDIQQVTESGEQLEQVKGILSELFPRFEEISSSWESRSWVSRSKREKSQEDEKRIFHPGIFPAYFRYELPQGLFSSVELEAFIRTMNSVVTDDGRQRIFLEKLSSMEKGSPKRDDFLRKLSDTVNSLPPQVRQALVHAAMRAADTYVYDSAFVMLGEAGHVLRIVIRVGLKIPKAERAALLSQCILEAADDTMAFRVLTKLTGEQSDFDLGVSMEQIYPSFEKRMMLRYGPNVDAANVNLTTADTNAFNLWGHHDAVGKAAQHDFWLRYIGENRSRLAQTFDGIFMPLGIYEKDPTPFVENKISTANLKRLYETLPGDESVTEADRKSLRRLKRFLDGEFKDGLDFPQLQDSNEQRGAEGIPSET
jgi:hypothetical protein